MALRTKIKGGRLVEMTPAEDAAHAVLEAEGLLAQSRAAVRARFIAEGLQRIALQEPAWDTMQEIKLIASIWARLNAPSQAHLNARAVYLYVENTVLPAIAGATQAQLDAVVPEAADPLPGVLPAWPVPT